MNSNGLVETHWVRVLSCFLLDCTLFVLAFVVAMLVHVPWDWLDHLERGAPALLIGAICVGSFSYLIGLYTTNGAAPRRSLMRLITMVLFYTGIALGGAMLIMVLSFYINFSSRIGRGIIVGGLPLALLLLSVHHLLIWRSLLRHYSARICLVINSGRDAAVSPLLLALKDRSLEIVGVVTGSSSPVELPWPVLGRVEDLADLVHQHRLDRVICTSETLSDNSLRNQFSTLRYSGTTVMTLLNLCEELFQCAPIPLVTPPWLLAASGSPGMSYIRKVKRLFDVVMATCGLLSLWPLLLLGMLAVRLTSRGPVIFRQRRCGRFGEPFELLKLRTMHQDAEKDGEAIWCKSDDPRITPVGRLLRKFRIDEIPQLINVLRGEMSFVGPRPERPEFVEQLEQEIPWYRERLLVHPGVTGWAQVNFPYGTTVQDARRKLEYDLYYMKHMGLFLDCFILLDTFRTVVGGSVWKTPREDLSSYLDEETPPRPAINPATEP